jgi:hypothetical protein
MFKLSLFSETRELQFLQTPRLILGAVQDMRNLHWNANITEELQILPIIELYSPSKKLDGPIRKNETRQKPQKQDHL